MSRCVHAGIIYTITAQSLVHAIYSLAAIPPPTHPPRRIPGKLRILLWDLELLRPPLDARITSGAEEAGAVHTLETIYTLSLDFVPVAVRTALREYLDLRHPGAADAPLP